jgi:hypothetical protein
LVQLGQLGLQELKESVEQPALLDRRGQLDLQVHKDRKAPEEVKVIKDLLDRLVQRDQLVIKEIKELAGQLVQLVIKEI